MLAEQNLELTDDQIPVARLLRFVGVELERMREATEGMQALISDALPPGSLRSGQLLSDLQNLDELTQVLSNLAKLQDRLADNLTADKLVDVNSVLSEIDLEALRDRLMGVFPPDGESGADNGEVDLF